MRIRRWFAVLAACAFLLESVAPCAAQDTADAPRRIALTFDDAPRIADAVFSRAERAQRIRRHLGNAGVRAAFFATTGELDDEGAGILRAYGLAGHQISNHSHLHRRLDRIGAAAFLADIDEAHAALRSLPGFVGYFRFPYLNEGATTEVRDTVRAGLRARGYRAGYVTIDTYDWYLNSLANAARRRGQSLDQDALGALYVESMVAAAEHYDTVAKRYLGRSPAHVLLLHENDLAALYLDRLIGAFEAHNWQIVDIDTAYADPIAMEEPDSLFLNQGRVAALADAAGAPRSALTSPSEDEAWLDSHFAEKVLGCPQGVAPSACGSARSP